MTNTPKLDAEAVDFILGRIAEDPEYRYLCGALTRTLEVCSAARAARTGQTPKEVQAEVLETPQGQLGETRLEREKAESTRLRKTIKKLRGEADE